MDAQRTALAGFFRKLGALLASGSPPVEALEAVSLGFESDPLLGEALARAAAEVRQGGRLSLSLARELQGSLPAELASRLAASEAAGSPGEACVELAALLVDGRLQKESVPSAEATAPSAQIATAGAGACSGHPRPGFEALAALVRDALASGASDVHLEPFAGGGRIRFRVEGWMRQRERLDGAVFSERLESLKAALELDPADRRTPQDSRVKLLADGRVVWLRASSIPCVFGESLTLRLLPEERDVPKLDELGLSTDALAHVRSWMARPWGLMLVSGSTGSGKTTMIYSLLKSLDAESSKIVTVEQPVEFIVEGACQLGLDPSTGLTWASAIRAQLRQDPDVLMIGEIRDYETAELTLQCALTGHAVLSVLHADGAAPALARMRNIGVDPFLLAASRLSILSMRLIRQLCKSCRERDPEPRLPAHLGAGRTLPCGDYYRAVGCPACLDTGYRGRIALYELGETSEELSAILGRQASSVLELRACLDRAGFATFLDDALAKAARGSTSLDELARVCAA